MNIDEFIKPNYTYMEVPEEFMCIYHKLLYYLADFGEDALKECETACSGKNKNILKCWGMFQSALAAKALGKDKLAEVLIKYIDTQLELIYRGTDKEMFNGGFILPIDENGYVHALASCANAIEFYLHNPLEPPYKYGDSDDEVFEPGNLYVRYNNEMSKHRDFYIEDDHLFVKSDLQV